MQTYDLLMLLVLVATTMFGFWKGMAWQIASLASLIVSYFAALRFSAQLAPTFGDHAPWNRFVAMLVIYIVTSFLIWTMFRLVSGAIDKVRLESFDRQLGAMFGLAKGVLLCVAITFFAVTLLPPAQGEAIVASQSGRYIVALLDKSHTVFPPEVHQVVDPYINRIEERLKPGGVLQGQDFQPLWPQNQASQSAPSSSWPAPWPQQPSSTPASSPQPQSKPPAQDWPPAQQWPPLGTQPQAGNQMGTATNPFTTPQASTFPQTGAQPQASILPQGVQPATESLFSTLRQAAKPLIEDAFHASQQATLTTPSAAPQPSAPANPFATPREAQLPDPYAVPSAAPHEPNPFPGPFSADQPAGGTF
jgi:membrane protein required for colicin V production